ncbi:hypothetical protein [Aquimarina sp. MMG016]|uniref:hypothetical protein n=1 Tax=Aquimarina sp. MMG016 TaxID=2822690 RepID=UPI001B3A6ABE|nr:hypothetical protein [Aquimarina sp. MMG016]MBQ4819826.1 hypothetical protein [Aquimarina sp. MMG016]
MKTKILKTVLAIVLLSSISCTKGDDIIIVDPSITSYEKQGSWDCNQSESCEDVYSFNFKKGAKVLIIIEDVSGNSVVATKVSKALSDINLLIDNDTNYLSCKQQDEDVKYKTIIIPEDGTYNIAVARDWGKSAGATGDYTIKITSDISFIDNLAISDDTINANYERKCVIDVILLPL